MKAIEAAEKALKEMALKHTHTRHSDSWVAVSARKMEEEKGA